MSEQERVTVAPKSTITLADGKEYIVKKLTLADTQKLLPLINDLDVQRAEGKVTVELLQLMIDISFLLLSKHNPELQKEQMAELLELNTVYALIALCSGTGN